MVRLFAVLLSIVIVVAAACERPTGPTGPTGPMGTNQNPPPPANYCIENLGDRTNSSTTFSSFWRDTCPGLMYPGGLSQFHTFSLSRRSNMKLSVRSETIDHNIDLDKGSVPDEEFELRAAQGPLTEIEEVLDAGHHIIEVGRRGFGDRHHYQLTLDVDDIPSADGCANLLQVDFYRDTVYPTRPLYDASFRNACNFDMFVEIRADVYFDGDQESFYSRDDNVRLSPGESGRVCTDRMGCSFSGGRSSLVSLSTEEPLTLYYTYTTCRMSGPDIPLCPDPEEPIPGVSPSVRLAGI